jgi:phage FluMu protein Com
MEHGKINVSTIREEKIYRDLSELPPELRQACEEEMANQTGGSNVLHVQATNRIVIDGKEYSGVEAMPDDVRRKYVEFIEAFSSGKNRHITTEIEFNGQKYSDVDAMPAEIRREYESIMATIDAARLDSRASEATTLLPIEEPIHYFHCRHCGAVVKALESQGGMQGKCPACGEMTNIPYVSTVETEAGAEFVGTGAVHRCPHPNPPPLY